MTGSSQRRREAAFRAGREDGLATAEAERNLFKGKYRSIVALLNSTRQQLQEIFDHVDDEGDRRYFGSTNHVDWLRDLLNDMDGWSIDAMLPKGDINKLEVDPYAEIRAQRARAEAADEARAEQWRLRRDAEGSRDTARATADTLRRERDEVRSALKLAIDHIEHMAAWLSGKGTGYSFESLGEDMPGIKAALSAQVQDARSDDDEEIYEIGVREGYERAVQEIDMKTGGDGEYRYCTDHDPERHTPGPAEMIQRIVDRFETLNLIDDAGRRGDFWDAPGSAQVQDVAGLLDETWNAAVEKAAAIANDCVHLTPDPGTAIRTMLNGRTKLHPAAPAKQEGGE